MTGHQDGSHPYLSGNFAPIQKTLPLTACTYTGTIPTSLAGGQYVRNGANPLANSELGRDAHWFDGDGMLSGVLFKRRVGKVESAIEDDEDGEILPQFINRFILSDLYMSTATTSSLRTPILPSISTLVNPASTLLKIVGHILRALLLVLISHLPGSPFAIKRISVANTSLIYHDGRALATCESGPPMRIHLPGLETVGWYNNGVAEGEPGISEGDAQAGEAGCLAFMREWTTGHPKVDPVTNELIMFHCMFLPPYVHYTVCPLGRDAPISAPTLRKVSIPNVSGAKMMHDFGVSATHTIILDLPLTLDPMNLAKGRPVVSLDITQPSRFGVFPRHSPKEVRWFETDACCIFHTANAWDEYDERGDVIAVHLLACRLTNANLVFNAGNIDIPPQLSRKRQPVQARTCSAPYRDILDEEKALITEADEEDDVEEDQCRLHHFRFSLADLDTNSITHSRPISRIPFEFPTLRSSCSMRFSRYVYGCSTRTATFGAALGKAAKVDVLVKMDMSTLFSRSPRLGPLDARPIEELLASTDPNDPIKVFAMPEGWVAQEAFFVPSSTANDTDEDDGHLLFYAFDEHQLDPITGQAPEDAVSELWILDARNMRNVVARIVLPQRVPYGLHGRWFTEAEIKGQRNVERFRSNTGLVPAKDNTVWDKIRKKLYEATG